MKRIIVSSIAAALLLLPCQRASAPLQVPLCLALKAVALPVAGATYYILGRCEPDYYLYKHEVESEAPFWFASQMSKRAAAANGDIRCRGPWKDREEPDRMARTNNEQPGYPPFNCAPLGTNPGPDTNALTLWLQHTATNGQSWMTTDNKPVSVDGGDNFMVALLPPTGTNGMSREQLSELRRCDLVMANPYGNAPVGQFRMLIR